MATIVSFKSDPRISDSERAELREFVSSAGQRIDALAFRLGLRVDAEDLPDDVSAVLIKSPNCGSESGFRIAVNRNHPFERRRLSIAHEIGHYVLHRRDPEFIAVEESEEYGEIVPLFAPIGNSYRAKGIRDHSFRLEQEADRFAVCLLMPVHLIRANASYRLGADRNLARDFAVSMEAMRWRVLEINIEKRTQTKGSIGTARNWAA